MVEMALAGLFLGMLLAAAIDFGRAYYTAVVVANMAGEGASYAALNPDYDQQDTQCTLSGSVPLNKTIQERVRRVARDRGLVIKKEDQDATIIVITSGDNSSTGCQQRCTGQSITVKVTYVINDLFLPGLLGFRRIPITKSASQIILRDPMESAYCH